MRIADLGSGEVRRRLASTGLRIHTGPVVAEVRSSMPAVADGIALHYAAHRVADADEFADFHAVVERPSGLRRWWRPQAVFRFDRNPPFKPLPAGQAFPLLEWGLNWCVSANCHQFLVLHAAVVERMGRALVLPGPPGSGKSTMCAALVARGWRLLSDELTLIDPEKIGVVPLPRPISLKNDSIAAIGRFWPEAVFGPTVHDTIKGSVAHVRPPAQSVSRADEAALPGWIVLPRYARGSSIQLERLSKAAAFMELANNAFNYHLHGRAGFRALGEFVAVCSTYEFIYGGDLDAAVDAFDRLPSNP